MQGSTTSPWAHQVLHVPWRYSGVVTVHRHSFEFWFCRPLYKLANGRPSLPKLVFMRTLTPTHLSAPTQIPIPPGSPP